MSAPTVAHALAAGLVAAGVQRVYGLPGEDHLGLLDAIEAAGLRYVGARDESSAAIMAAVEAQASGVPGVVLVTIAPGLTNAINGIACASLDHIPLLVITGQHHPDRAPLIVRQLLDNQRLVHSLTKWTASASPRIHQILAKALDTALAPPGGPVLLEVRDDVARLPPADAAADWPVLQAEARTMRMGTTETPDAASVERLQAVGELVWSARRPAIIVGGCSTDPRLPKALSDVAGRLRAPVFVSPSGLGTLNQDEPWFAGTFMNGNFERGVLEQCDAILAVDLDAKDFFNAAWRYRARVVAINTRPDVQRYIPAHHQVLGDVATILQVLAVCRSDAASAWTSADVADYRAQLEQPFGLTDPSALTIPAALRAARALLSPETLVAVDAGFGKPIASYLWSAPRSNRYFTAHGLSTMGYALPAANALQLAFPDRSVVGFMGDGSLLMRASEIGVAVQHGCAPIYVAWMDGALAQIEAKQLRQDLRPVGARLPVTSCTKLADAFGGLGVDVETLSEFKMALEAARQERHVPTLIGARVDQTSRAHWYELMRG